MTDTGRDLILVVDDDPMFRLMAQTALESNGFQVIEASSGEGVVELCLARAPQLVLLDVMMPGIDGYEVCAALRRAPAGAHIPVLMMTGLDDLESINRAYEVGATDFITKPLNYALLAHRLRYMLRAKHTADALRESETRLAAAQEIARLGHWETDADGRIQPLAARARSVLCLPDGAEVTEFSALASLARPDHRARLGAAFEAARREGSDLTVEFVLETAAGPREIHLRGVAETTAGRVRHFGTVQDVSERREAQRQIRRLAFFDGVTGLPNRALLRRRLDKALALARRNDRSLAVLAVDLDGFQRINEALGYEAGNRLLRTAAERIEHCIRGSDWVSRAADEDAAADRTVARGGGDEFFVMLPEIGSSEDAAVVARRIQTSLAEAFDIDTQQVFLGATIGISVFPDDGATADELLKHADAALAQAKQSGRNSYEFFSANLNARAFKRLSLEMALRRALDAQEFELYYQPKLRCTDLVPIGVEALVRWNHRDLGRVSPADFIPIAEETGLIVPLGEWVFATACRQVRAWMDAGLGVVNCAVNVSPAQFRQPDLARRLAEAMRRAGVEPQAMSIELTESMLMNDPQAASNVLGEMKSLGLTVSVDDFGTGYSSLSYLRRLPIDALKIDQSFVRELTEDDDSPIVSTIISLAHNLRLKTVAEGVENAVQLDFLRRHGCDQVQGYMFSTPLPVAELEGWWRARTAARAAG